MVTTVKAQNNGVYPGSPSQGPTSGVTGPLAAGVTPSITVNPVAFLSFSPNPIGVGQQLGGSTCGQLRHINPERWESGYIVSIIKPDGP